MSGEGRNDHCFRHLAAARATAPPGPAATTDRPSKFPMLERIREIESSGRTVRVDILRYGMSPTEALTVEAAVHDALGLPDRAEAREPTTGGRGPQLVAGQAGQVQTRASTGVAADRRSGSDPSYDSARHGWPIGRRWTDLDSRSSPQWAAVVVADLVVAVYRIHRWEQDRAHGGRHRPAPAAAPTTSSSPSSAPPIP